MYGQYLVRLEHLQETPQGWRKACSFEYVRAASRADAALKAQEAFPFEAVTVCGEMPALMFDVQLELFGATE